MSEFENECLAAHNAYRAKHGVPPLTLNTKLSEKSQKWADHLIARKTFGHNPDEEFKDNGQTLQTGENIASISSTPPRDYPGENCSKAWYDEIKDYDFKDHKSKGDAVVGHFTQVVWLNSTELGCARATDGKGRWVAVANYSPPGNYRGKNAKNVFPCDSGQHARTDSAAASAPQPAAADNVAQMLAMSLNNNKDESSGDKKPVRTSTSRKTMSKTASGKTTKTTIITTTYTYADSSTRVETTEEVEQF